MPTDAQIKAVARELERANRDWEGDGSWIEVLTRAAIAAYEATRPAVATDRELWEAFWDHAEIVDGDTESIRAGIRAVRERLALAAPALSRPEFQIGDVVHVAGKGRQRFDIVVHHKEKYGVCREGVQENHRLVDPESLIPLAAALAETEESDHAD